MTAGRGMGNRRFLLLFLTRKNITWDKNGGQDGQKHDFAPYRDYLGGGNRKRIKLKEIKNKGFLKTQNYKKKIIN